MKGFSEKETLKLINEAVKANSNGGSLTKVFGDFAVETKRAKGSVRNYYYQLLKKAENQAALKAKYEGLNRLKAKRPTSFLKEDEKALLDAVKEGVKQGKSVRKSIIDIADGDQRLMLRYQNKFRNLLKNGEVENSELYRRKSSMLFYDEIGERYYEKLSSEINGLVERIKAKYAQKSEQLSKQIEILKTENARLKQKLSSKKVKDFFAPDKIIKNSN